MLGSPRVLAGCVSVQFGGDKSSVGSADTINLTATVTRTDTTCLQADPRVIINLFAQTSATPSGAQVDGKVMSFNGGTSISYTFSVVPSQVVPSPANPANYGFFVKILDANAIQQTQSSPVNITNSSASGSGSQSSSPTVKADKSNYNIGDTMNLTVSNMGSNVASGEACVNSGNQCFNFTNSGGSATVQIPVNTDEYFQTSGSNTITVNLFDSSNNQLTSPQGNPISVTTGSAAASTPCTGGPALQGSCSPGLICSAATGGTCSIAVGGQTSNSYATLVNPISKFDNLTALLVNIMKGFLGIIAVWAVAFIVIGGFRMVISSGQEEAILAAKKTITWAVLGLLVAVLSFAIIAIVQNLVGVNIPAATTPGTVTIPPGTVTIPPGTVTTP